MDSRRDVVQGVNARLREMGRAELPEDLVASYVGSGAPILISRALGGAASEMELQSALKYFLEHYHEHKLDFTKEYPGVREALHKLRGVPMAVLTNKPVNISVRILEGLGLAGFFRAIYGGKNFVAEKPDTLRGKIILKGLIMPAT